MMRSYAIVDVFTEIPLEGNPAAVFTDSDGLTPEVMQRTARELNLSETVFLAPGDGDADVRARIFTPAVELPFAGHPVLAAAIVFAGSLGMRTVRVGTGSGIVQVALGWEGDRIESGEMEQPIPTWEPLTEAGRLLAAVGVSRSELPVEVYDNGPRHAFVRLGDEAAVAALRPDHDRLAELGELGISCFALGDGAVKTRMFAPALGVAEDPATGSAAGPLAVHLARHGAIAFGQEIEIHQGAEIGRPSLLRAVAHGSPETVDRVLVSGHAVVVARGDYRLD